MTTPPPYGAAQSDAPSPSPGKPGLLKRKGVQLAGAGLLGLVLGTAAGGGGGSAADSGSADTSALEQQLAQARADVERLTDERDQQTLRGNQIAEQAKADAAAREQEDAEAPEVVAEEEPAPAAEPAPAPEGDLADGSFTSTTPQLEDDGLGDFGGTARVTNTSDEEKTGVFTYTLFIGSEQVGTAQGSADAVGAGETATVQLISTDDFRSGVDRVEFQVDLES